MSICQSSYDRWFRAKVQEALDDPSPSIPHHELMARIEGRLRTRQAASALPLDHFQPNAETLEAHP